METKPPSEDNFEFNWIQTRKDIGLPDVDILSEESAIDKFKRKFKENPLVPIGVTATTICLGLGLMSLKRGDSKMSQMMMRGRVIAQGLTIAALVTGVCLQASSSMEDSNDPQ